MSAPVEKWVESVKKRFDGIPYPVIQQGLFLRDPIRRMTIDPDLFYSPADGTIMYQKIVDSNKDVVSIKGMHYTLSDLMETEFTNKCLVIGIFMSYLDVHVNRIPYGGMLKFKYLSPIVSTNKPMENVENDILSKKLGKAFTDMGNYLKYNARMVNEVYIPSLDYSYYITQIADDEVNVITHFTTEQNKWFHQNERFSFVRWGSQVELVLPLDDRYNFKPLVPEHYHVKGCIDALIRMERKEDKTINEDKIVNEVNIVSDYAFSMSDVEKKMPSIKTRGENVGNIGEYQIYLKEIPYSSTYGGKSQKFSIWENDIVPVGYLRLGYINWLPHLKDVRGSWEIGIFPEFQGQGLAIKMYFWALTHVCKIIASDNFQTRYGKALWKKLFNIGMFEIFSTNNGDIKQITNEKELEAAYGDEETQLCCRLK